MGDVFEGEKLTTQQVQLLEELAGLTGAALGAPAVGEAKVGPAGREALDCEALCRRWSRAALRSKPGHALVRPAWAWIQRLRHTCEATCCELDVLLGHVNDLDGHRQEVARKTALLHERSKAVVRDMDQLGSMAEGISQRLGAFDAVVDIGRALDQSTVLASLSGFASILDQIESATAFMETHYDFSEAKACLQQFEHLRNRSCILLRTSLQRSLERAEAQVHHQLWEEAHDGSVDTHVFYTPFHAISPSCKPLMTLLHKRLHLHKLYAATLEELETFYVVLRVRLVSEPTREHIKAMFDMRLPSGQLAQLLREAGSHFFDVSRWERQCFLAFFEARQPQSALQELLETLGNVVYGVLQPAVLAPSSLDALHGAAEYLQEDVLEAHRQSASDGSSEQLPAGVERLQRHVLERLVAHAKAQLYEGVARYVASGQDVDYPSALFPEARQGGGWDGTKGRAWFPSLERTLGVLAKTCRVLEAPVFEGLACEAVGMCLASLKEASGFIAVRPLPDVPGVLSLAARAMDSRLFLARHLLVLREQLSALEYGAAAEGPCAAASRPAALEGLPGAFWGRWPAKPQRLQFAQGCEIERELTATCGALVTDLTAWISKPVAIFDARVTELRKVEDAGGAAAGGKTPPDMAALAMAVAEAFLSNIRGWVPLVCARLRAYLTTPGAGGPGSSPAGQMGIEMETGAAAVLFKPLRQRLISAWSRVLTNLGRHQPLAGSSALGLSGGLPSAGELGTLLSQLFDEAMRLPWSQVAEAVACRAPRAVPALPSVGLPCGPCLAGPSPVAQKGAQTVALGSATRRAPQDGSMPCSDVVVSYGRA